MPNILVRNVDLGFDASVRDAAELPRGSAADGSKGVLYSRKTIKTPYGFEQVESGSLPLDSGHPVLGMGMYSELDKTQHFLAVTTGKIYKRDYRNSEWDDITQSGQALGGNIYNPVSIAAVLHTDGLALNGDGDDWYHHCLVSTGGTAPIQRWAGKFETDFADLAGADGYHAVGSTYTTHFARQVGAFFNRTILISPKESNADDTLVDNNQRIRWPQAGKLEIWVGTGSGAIDLLDTGGYNVWGALLGSQWIQYQNNSIWSLTHVGGTRVFEPDIEMPDIGLLSPHLLYSKNNVHYFVGHDYKVYAYYGGSNIKEIGRKIHRFLQRDLDPAYAARCWLCMGAENSRLWLYIVRKNKTYATEAYAIDVNTGAWMKRDFTHKWPTGGITSVALVGAGSYISGESFAEALATGKTFAEALAEGTTFRQALQTVLTDERIVIGDSAGYIYQYDPDLTTDDDISIPSRHMTEVDDLGQPSKNKIWPGIRLTAKGTSVVVAYRTASFETENDGWTEISPAYDVIDECIGHWEMNDDADDTNIIDSSTSGNDGTARRNTSTLHTAGKMFGALTFAPASVDYITLTSKVSLSVFYAMNIWIYLDDDSNRPNYLFYDRAGLSHIYIQEQDEAASITFRNSAGETAQWTGLSSLKNSWKMITFVSVTGGTAMQLFINNTYISSKTLSTAFKFDVIGHTSGSYTFSGKMDCLSVFDTTGTLAAAARTILYNSGNGQEIITNLSKQALTSEFLDYDFFINDTSKKIQFMFGNVSSEDPTLTTGDDFQISNYELISPVILGEV